MHGVGVQTIPHDGMTQRLIRVHSVGVVASKLIETLKLPLSSS